MWWWVAAILTWLVSFAGIKMVMTDVVRGKTTNLKALPWYLFHGATAVLVLWFIIKALGV